MDSDIKSMKKSKTNLIFIFILFFLLTTTAANAADEKLEFEAKTEALNQAPVQIDASDSPHEVIDHNARLPFVIKTKPLDAETDVALNSQIKIVFNKPMDYLSINSSSIMVMDEVGSVIEGAISYDSSSYTATFSPRTMLSKNTLYNLFIPSYLVKDSEGNSLDKNVTFSFRTESKNEVTKIYENRKAPKTVKNYPDSNATDVPLDSYVIADFNLPLLSSRITDETIKLNDGARDIDGKSIYSDKERQILFVPGKNLEYGKVYRVILNSSQIESVHGFKMAENYSWTFSTKKPRDEAPPEVISTSPLDGSYDVSEQAKISASFSEEIDPTTLNKYTVILSDGNHDVDGKITYDKRTSKIVFFPLEKLKSGQKYTMMIATGVKDTAGNPIQLTREWTFTTKKTIIAEKPKIIKTYPKEGETEIKTDSKLFVYFNKVMNESNCNVFNIRLSQDNKTLPISTTFVKNGNFVTIIPLENLQYSSLYKLSLSSRITDLEGQSLDSDFMFSFTTMNKPDISAPEILKSTPDDGALNIAINSIVSVKFSEPILKNTISQSTIIIKNEKGISIKGYSQYEEDQNLLTFIPESKFDYMSKYVVKVSDDVKDFAGNRLKASKIWAFTTIQAPDTTPPKVISCLPKKSERDIDIKTAIQLIFSERIPEKCINGKTIQLYDSNGNEVSAAVTYDGILKKAAITPRRDLEYAMTYKIIVSKLVCDAAENYMKSTFTSDFTTATAPDKTRPELESTKPESGAINVSLDSEIYATFTKKLDPMTVTNKNVFLRNENEHCDVEAEIVYNDRQKKIVIVPKEKLKYSTSYQVVVSRGVTDIAGNLFNSTVFFEFTTLDEPDVSAPEIRKAAPVNLSKNVPIDTSVFVWFSEKVKDSTITEKNVSLCRLDGSKASEIFCKIAYDEKDLKMIITPISKLSYSAKYKLNVKNLTDAFGNTLKSAYSLIFETEEEPDQEPPAVIMCHPANNSKNISTITPIYVKFSERIETSTLNADNIRLSVNSKQLECDIIYQPDSFSVLIKPSRQLEFERLYTVDISPEISDIHSNKMGVSYVFQFKTAVLPDLETPKIKTVYPPNAASDVSKNVQIQATFSKKLKAKTVNKYTFFLTNENAGEQVNGKVVYDAQKNAAVFMPDNELKDGYNYRATVTEGISDNAGNPLEKGVSWSFTIGKPKDTSKFEVISTYPRDNEVHIPADMEFSAVFNKIVNENTANEYTILVNDGVKTINGSISIDSSGKKVIFKPKSPLKKDAMYSITITNGLEDTDGNSLSKKVKFCFKTKK